MINLLVCKQSLTILITSLGLIVLFSCNKVSSVTSNNTSNQTSIAGFNVRVKERYTTSAIVEWDSAYTTGRKDTVKYKVWLNNKIKDSNLLRFNYYFTGLHRDSTYLGRVVAYTRAGDTLSKEFRLSVFDGFVYLFQKFGGDRFAAFGATTDNRNSNLIWAKPSTDLGITPTISNDTIFLPYISSYSGKVEAISAKTGSSIWSTTIPSGLVYGAINYHQGNLYLCRKGELVALNSKTGSVIWKAKSPVVGYDLESNPVISNDKIFANTLSSAGLIAAYKLSDGSLLWSSTYPQANYRFICTRPLLANNMIIFSTSDSKVYALNQTTGSIIWVKDFNIIGGTMNSYEDCPIRIGDKVIVYIINKGWYALSISTGSILWEYKEEGIYVSKPTYGNGNIYFVSNRSASGPTLTSINASSGQLNWRKSMPLSPHLYEVIFAKNRLYVRDNYDILQCDVNTGEIVSSITNRSADPTSFIIKWGTDIYYPSSHSNYTTE